MDKEIAEKPKLRLRKVLGGFKQIKCPDCGASFQLDERYSEIQEVCPRCGKGITDSGSYCPNCGQMIDREFINQFGNTIFFGEDSDKKAIAIYKGIEAKLKEMEERDG